MGRRRGVEEESRNFPGRVYGISPCPLAGGCACTGRVEDDEITVLRPDETVPHIGCVPAESGDRPGRADAEGVGALKRTCPRARCVKGDNGLRRYWDGYRQRGEDRDSRHEPERQPSFLKVNFCFHIRGLTCVFLSIVFLRAKIVPHPVMQ